MTRLTFFLLAVSSFLPFQSSFADLACNRGNPERTGVHLVPEVTDFHGMKWKLKLDIDDASSPLFYRSKFIISHSKGTTLIEPSGKILWTLSEVKTNSENQTPAAHNGVIYTAGEKLHAIDFRTGNILWTHSLGYWVWSPLAVDGKIYVSSDTGVYAFDSDGNSQWQSPLQSKGSSPTLANGVLYIVDRNGNLNALNASNGQQIWTFTGSGKQARSTVAVSNGIVYFSDGEILHAVDLNGKEVWNFAIETDNRRADPTVIDGQVYIGGRTSNNTFVSLNALTGENIWTFKPSGYSTICSSSEVAGDLIYFTTCSDSYVVALERQTGKLRWLSEPTSYPSSFSLGAGLLLFFHGSYYKKNIVAIY